LIRNWGDVPAQFVPSSFAGDLYIPKEDRHVIYDQILADLEEAATLVPWRSEVPLEERITQGAIRALRARIALAAGGFSLHGDQMTRVSNYLEYYQIAQAETQAIINSGEHQLNPSFEAIWKDAVCAKVIEPTGEVIWELGMSGGNSQLGDSKMGYYNGPRANTKGNSALTVLPTTFYAYDPNDTRRDVTCAIYDLDANKNVVARSLATIVDGKYRRDWIVPSAFESTSQYFGLNWVMIRYSDVLLMFAESENELNNGPTAAAIDAFEDVRLRAFGGDPGLIGVTPSTYTGFFDAIMKERMLELCGEGIRKYDLIRWNLLGQRLDEVKAQLADMELRLPPYDVLPTVMFYTPGSPTLVWQNSFYTPSPAQPPGSVQINWLPAGGSAITNTLLTFYAVAFTPNKSELLPFHTNTLEANNKLTQNLGY
jgi:hypothetical protein